MKNHERPALIAQDIMGAEVTPPQGGVVNIPTMTMMSLQKNIVNRMSTTSATLLLHHGIIATTAAALVDTVRPATPQRTLNLQGLPGPTPKIHLVALMAGSPHPPKGGVVQSLALPMEAHATQASSLVSLFLVITMALGDEAKELKVIGQLAGDQILPSHRTCSHLRDKLGSSDQRVRGKQEGIQVLNNLMETSRCSSSSSRVYNNNNSNSHHSTIKAHRVTSKLQAQELDQDSNNSKQDLHKLHHRDANQESGLQQGSQPRQ